MELRAVKNKEVVATQIFFTGIHCGEWSNLTLRHIFQVGWFNHQRKIRIFFVLSAWSWFIKDAEGGHQPRFMVVYASFHSFFWEMHTENTHNSLCDKLVTISKGFLILCSGSKNMADCKSMSTQSRKQVYYYLWFVTRNLQEEWTFRAVPFTGKLTVFQEARWPYPQR